MRGSNLAFVPLALFTTTCLASPVARPPPRDKTVSQLSSTQFFSFPNNGQAENIKPRSSGQLLATVNTAPDLYQVNPFKNNTGGIVHSFEAYTSLFGIAETTTDLFYVIAGNYSMAPNYYGYAGTFSIFEINLSGIADPTVDQSFTVSKIVDIPEAELLDGLAAVTNNILVTGDAQTGIIYTIDIASGTATAVLQSALLNGTTTDPAASLAHIGINGLKYHSGALYYTNTALFIEAKIPINTATGVPTGEPTTLTNYGTYTDELSFDRAGNQFVSTPLNGIVYQPAGTTSVNDSTLLVSLYGANSNAFGRSSADSCILYATFDGVPSGIVKVDTNGQFCNGVY